MKITIESTSRIVEVTGGVEARVWEGTSDGGVPVVALVTRIAAPNAEDLSAFDRELQEMRAPTSMAIEAFPTRLVL